MYLSVFEGEMFGLVCVCLVMGWGIFSVSAVCV